MPIGNEPEEVEEQIPTEGEEETVVEEQEVEDGADEQETDEADDSVEQDEPDVYEVDVPNDAGGYDTEQVNINDLPYILAGARKLQARELELEQQQQQLSQYNALLNFVTTDSLTKAIAQYRLEGVSEFEAIEAVYNYYLQNNLGKSIAEDPDLDPKVRELQDKVRKYDEFFENQEKTRNIDENNKFLAQEAINLGYRIDEQDLPVVIDEANRVAFQLFSEIAPDIPPDQFTALRKITPGIARAIWDETSRRLKGRLGGEQQQQQQQNTQLVRKKMAAQKMQQASISNKEKKRPTRIISGKKGTDVTSAKATKSVPYTPKGSSSKDRAQALKALFGSTE